MKFTAWRTRAFAGLCLATGAITMAPLPSWAGVLQDTIFAKATQESKPRLFFKLSAISAHVRTTSKDAQDVTGPVLARTDFADHLFNGTFVSSFETKRRSNAVPREAESFEGLYNPDELWVAQSFFGILDREFQASGCQAIRNGLGTPCGIKVKSSTEVGTAAVSVGYHLDEGHNWQVEAFILAAPIATSVYGDGANQLRGQKIIETKLLPPIVTIGRQFGQYGQLRPYVGLGVSYAVFFDTRATGTLNAYQGGSGPNDTTVRIHNSWGLGPFVGMSYGASDTSWQFGFTIGRLRYKPETTLTTHNTRITSDSAVLADYGARASTNLKGAEGVYSTSSDDTAIVVKATNTPEGFTAGQRVPLTTAVMCDLARAKNGSNDCNLGTYQRKASTTLDNTLFMLTIGRNF